MCVCLCMRVCVCVCVRVFVCDIEIQRGDSDGYAFLASHRRCERESVFACVFVSQLCVQVILRFAYDFEYHTAVERTIVRQKYTNR